MCDFCVPDSINAEAVLSHKENIDIRRYLSLQVMFLKTDIPWISFKTNIFNRGG